MSFNKIIVAIDRSSQASSVFRQAVGIARLTSASIHFFHCLELKSNTSSVLKVNREIAKAQELLADYQTLAKVEDIDAKFSYLAGDAGKMICQSARELQADLILLGRRGYRGLADIITGGVSNYVVRHAPCSVLVVQNENFNS